MFKIKTKKDKRIEELEALLHSSTFLNQPRIVETRGNIVTYRVMYKLEAGSNPSTDVVKRIMSKELSEKIINDMNIDISDEYGEWIITADIKVIK